MARRAQDDFCDVFLSHSHVDADDVEEIAGRLEDEHGLRPWLDRWVLIPGRPWQPELARGLAKAASCAVCLGHHTPRGWFEREIEKAMNRQTQDGDFRVIPVLLPSADAELSTALQESFLELNTWVDFRNVADRDRAFHLLVCGVRGVAPGRWTAPAAGDPESKQLVDKLHELRRLRQAELVDESVGLEIQRKIVEKLLDF